KGAVVDGFRLGHFAMRPAPDFFRGRQADANGIEISHGVCHIKGARTKHVPPLSCSQKQYPVPSSQYPVCSFKCFAKTESYGSRNVLSNSFSQNLVPWFGT